MRKTIKTALVFILMSGLLSCGQAGTYTADINIMRNEDFYFEFVLFEEGDESTEQSGVFARCGGWYYLRFDDTVLLHSKKERYAIDIEQKTYWDDKTADLNFYFFDALFASLKAVETKTNEDGTATVECKNKHKKRIVLTYKDDVLSKIDLFLYSDEFSTSCRITKFSSTIPSDIQFSIPEGYTKTDGYIR